MPLKHGDDALMRNVFRGRVCYALPCKVVSADTDAVVTYLAPDTIAARPEFSDRRELFHLLVTDSWTMRPFAWSNHHLQLTRRGDGFAISLIWDETWTFLCWYVNLQEPLRTSSLGFDTMDHVLDVVVAPDRTWRWKDEEELELAVALGIFTSDDALSIREEGARAIRHLYSHPALEDHWLDWRPPASWAPVDLPTDWELVAGDSRETV